MVTTDWDDPEQRSKLVKLHATKEITESFRKLFKREMTQVERHTFMIFGEGSDTEIVK